MKNNNLMDCKKSIYLIITLLLFSNIAYAKKIKRNDVQINTDKVTDGTITVEEVNHLEGINALQITLKATKNKKEDKTKIYSCTVRDISGNSLKNIDVYQLPKEVGIKKRMNIPISYLPKDLKLPIIINFKVKYICSKGKCLDVSN